VLPTGYAGTLRRVVQPETTVELRL
jgi:hypothetical protein